MIKWKPKKVFALAIIIIILPFFQSQSQKKWYKSMAMTEGGMTLSLAINCATLYISIYGFKLIQANNADNYGLNVSIMQVLTNCF